MPRNARSKSEKQVYHIMLRGNNKERIFNNEEDKLRIIPCEYVTSFSVSNADVSVLFISTILKLLTGAEKFEKEREYSKNSLI